jgi:hypothetical protein
LSIQESFAGSFAATRARNARGQFLPGQSGNPHGHGLTLRRLRDKVAVLKATFGPDAQFSALDESRLLLAAKHYEIARKSRDPNTSVRSINAAERLLAAIPRPAEKPKAETIDDVLRGGR